MPFESSAPTVQQVSWLGPAVIAAVVSGIVAIVGFLVSTRTARTIHAERLTFDKDMAERKFAFDKDLAERKFKYDRELHDHKRRVELAESILTEFQEMSAIMREIRSPMAYSGESADRPNRGEASEDRERQLDSYYVPLARLNRNREFINAFLGKRYRAAAVLGKGMNEAFEIVREQVIKVQVSAQSLMRSVGSSPRAMEKNLAFHERCEADIGWVTENEDLIAQQMKVAVETAEAICLPILNAPQ